MPANRIIYLEEKSRQVATEQMLAHFIFDRKFEQMRAIDAVGRISAAPIIAKRSVPHYHASAMDGVAVVAEETFTAHEQNPLKLLPGKFVYVDTGNPIPEPFNAVIMIEYIEELDDGAVEIIEPATPWQHIRPIGEDITEEEMLFTVGHSFRPVDVGALLAGGHTEVSVVKKPTVAIIPTGHELVQAHHQPDSGKLIEFNGAVFSSFIHEWGGEPLLRPIATDIKKEIQTAITDATEKADVVVINGGSSAGSKDFTYKAIAELGEVFTHGIACRPGHPVVIGKVNGKIIVGIPGYPVSAYLTLEWFIRPLISAYLGIKEPVREKLKVRLGRRVVSKMGIEDFIRVNVQLVNGRYVAVPLTRAAGVTMSLVRAEALLVVPPSDLGYEIGDEVEVELLKPVSEIRTALAFNGSHDMAIDILSTHWKKQNETAIVSSHTGSMAGILAVTKGEAHVAGIHLLDPETGEYNLPYVKKFTGDEALVVQPFLKRKQGFIVAKGNPLGIRNVADLVGKADYVNRQKGAGTRILFDLLLREAGILSEQISGYNREFFSHLSVGAEVKNSETTVGLGIYSAAKIFDLDFVPVADESYDLLMTKNFYQSNLGQELLQLIRSEVVKSDIEALGGYEVVADAEPIYL